MLLAVVVERGNATVKQSNRFAFSSRAASLAKNLAIAFVEVECKQQQSSAASPCPLFAFQRVRARAPLLAVPLRLTCLQVHAHQDVHCVLPRMVILILISSPLTLLVALWGMTGVRTLELMASKRQQLDSERWSRANTPH